MTTATTPPTPPTPPAVLRRRRVIVLVALSLVLVLAGAAVAVAAFGGRSGIAPATPSASAPAAGPEVLPVAVFLGDSYTQGFGAHPLEQRWSSLVALDAGWTEANQGLGGTGFVAVSDVNACGLEYCPNYVERVQDVIDVGPDIVLIAGGQNDRSALATDPERVRAAVDATYDGIRQGLPGARIIAVGPSTAEPATALLVELDSWVQAAAARVGAEYVSLIDPVVIQSEMVAPDGVHVTAAGYRAIADRVLTVARDD